MQIDVQWGPLVLVLLGALIWALYHQHRERERRHELAGASHNGLSFQPKRDKTFADAYPNFPCLWQGRSRWAFNIAEGS